MSKLEEISSKVNQSLNKIEDLKPGNHLCCIYETDQTVCTSGV